MFYCRSNSQNRSTTLNRSSSQVNEKSRFAMTSRLRSGTGDVITSTCIPHVDDGSVVFRSYVPSGGGTNCFRLVLSSDSSTLPSYCTMLAYRAPPVGIDANELAATSLINGSTDEKETPNSFYKDSWNIPTLDVSPCNSVSDVIISPTVLPTSGNTMRRTTAIVFPKTQTVTS